MYVYCLFYLRRENRNQFCLELVGSILLTSIILYVSSVFSCLRAPSPLADRQPMENSFRGSTLTMELDPNQEGPG